MKRSILAVALGLSALAAQAAGPFDGIYQDPDISDLYMSVHQGSDNSVTGAFFYSMAATGTSSPQPKRYGLWWLTSGLAVGSTVTLTGEDWGGWCNMKYVITRLSNGNLSVVEGPHTLTSFGTLQSQTCNSKTYTYEMPKVK